MAKESTSTRDISIGIISLIISAFFLFTKTGRNLFVPFESCATCLDFYYYLIAYGLSIAAIFFILRGLKVIKGD
jgi:hypothetical protein